MQPSASGARTRARCALRPPTHAHRHAVTPAPARMRPRTRTCAHTRAQDPPQPVEGRSLGAYIRLPLSQYTVLDPRWISRAPSTNSSGTPDEFVLTASGSGPCAMVLHHGFGLCSMVVACCGPVHWVLCIVVLQRPHERAAMLGTRPVHCGATCVPLAHAVHTHGGPPVLASVFGCSHHGRSGGVSHAITNHCLPLCRCLWRSSCRLT